VRLREDVLKGERCIQSIARVTAVHEAAQPRHLLQGVRQRDGAGEHCAGLRGLDDGLGMHHGEVPVRRGQAVDAPVWTHEAQPSEQGRRHVVRVPGSAGDLLTIQSHG